MKKNKKGFTLIELLAVIVILGIILTIVVSNVVKYVSQARKGSYKDAVAVFVKNVQTALMADAVEGGSGTINASKTYDYDTKNMKISITASGTDKYLITVEPTDTGSFKGLKMSGDDNKYCPPKATCDAGGTNGKITFYMTADGELTD